MEERFYDVTIYEAGCNDYDNEGICGPLFPIACYHDEERNGGSEVTLEHPFDDQGKWREITAGRILKCWVQNRIVPEINNNRIVTNVEKWIVKAGTSSDVRAVYNKPVGGCRLKTLPAGLVVTVVQKPSTGRYKFKSATYGTGFVNPEALEYESSLTIANTIDGIEAAEPGDGITWQLFEITKVKRKDDSGIVANAHLISYQMLTNNTSWKTLGAASIGTALTGILESCKDEHDFNAYTNMTATNSNFGWRHLNPIKCMLDPEAGITGLFSCEVVRDNWDLYFFADAGKNRGVRIEPEKNMEGVEYDEDMTGLYTHIMPIGYLQNGEEFLLPELYVVSPLADAYSRKFIYPLRCSDCEVGKNGVTLAIAYERMRAQAQAVLDGGCDVITKSVKITLANLQGSSGEKIAAKLERILVGDYVTALHPDFMIDLVMKVVQRRWDCLRGRIVSVEMGTVAASLAMGSVASWQIPNGVNGSKLVAGSVGSNALGDAAVTTRHLQAASINTDALQAKSITTEKIAAGAVTAEKIAAGVIDTVSLEAITAKIESLTASDIATDRLAAGLAAFTVITAGTASFDQATVQHLVANALNLTFGTAGEVFIENLRVIYGQMVQATIGNLCIKASDGNYYTIDVNADGNVTATQTTVTDGEISAGETDSGRVILETHITAESLNTGNLLATYALINKIDAARIDVEELFANSAFIAHLQTADISSNTSILITAGKAEEALREALDAAAAAAGAQSTANSASNAAANAQTTAEGASAAAGNAQTAADNAQSTADSAQAAANNAQTTADAAQSAADAAQSTADSAAESAAAAQTTAANAGATASAAVETIGRIPQHVEVADDGLYLKDQNMASVLKINSASVTIGTLTGDGAGYSQLAANYVQFGNYQLRKSADGGLVFKLKG